MWKLQVKCLHRPSKEQKLWHTSHCMSLLWLTELVAHKKYRWQDNYSNYDSRAAFDIRILRITNTYMQFYILAPRAAPDLITIREASNKIFSFATMKSSMLCTTQEKWMSGNSDYGDSSTYQFVEDDTCLELEFQNAGRATKIGLLKEIVHMSFLP